MTQGRSISGEGERYLRKKMPAEWGKEEKTIQPASSVKSDGKDGHRSAVSLNYTQARWLAFDLF